MGLSCGLGESQGGWREGGAVGRLKGWGEDKEDARR